MIELQHVSVGYGAQDVVRDVSFAAPNGQLTALIGPNGSGKTTLLRAMTRTRPAAAAIFCWMTAPSPAMAAKSLPAQQRLCRSPARCRESRCGRWWHMGGSRIWAFPAG